MGSPKLLQDIACFDEAFQVRVAVFGVPHYLGHDLNHLLSEPGRVMYRLPTYCRYFLRSPLEYAGAFRRTLTAYVKRPTFVTAVDHCSRLCTRLTSFSKRTRAPCTEKTFLARSIPTVTLTIISPDKCVDDQIYPALLAPSCRKPQP